MKKANKKFTWKDVIGFALKSPLDFSPTLLGLARMLL